MTWSVFFMERPVSRLSGVMIHGLVEKSNPHGKTITIRKGTSVLTSFTSTEVPLSPLSLPPTWCCLKYPSPEGRPPSWCTGWRPEPTLMHWGNASKTCASIPQDTADHNRRELAGFCQECWRFAYFWHNNGTIAALELMTKLKIDACRNASDTQGRLRGALTSQKIAKYVEYCLKHQAPTSAPMSSRIQCQTRNS